MSKPKSGVAGSVYFIYAEAVGLIKIGFTADKPEKRLKALSQCNPVHLTLLGYTYGTMAEEKVLHRKFVHHGARGEWFRDCPEIREFIEQCCVSPDRGSESSPSVNWMEVYPRMFMGKPGDPIIDECDLVRCDACGEFAWMINLNRTCGYSGPKGACAGKMRMIPGRKKATQRSIAERMRYILRRRWTLT